MHRLDNAFPATESTLVGGFLFDAFDQVRIINLVDRADRRGEMIRELDRVGGSGPNVAFHDARRPSDAAGFPTVGARGCFESHLAVLRSARDAKARSLLILEDDLDFTRDARGRGTEALAALFGRPWDVFYGAHLLAANGQSGLAKIEPDVPVITASFVAFNGHLLASLVEFLEAMLRRPPGSPDYGPMHVDGAYTVFRLLHPQYTTLAAFPPLGRQRSSLSDITPSNMFLDRWNVTQPLASFLRRQYNSLRRR